LIEGLRCVRLLIASEHLIEALVHIHSPFQEFLFSISLNTKGIPSYLG
jgi:hypothetical protein